MIFDRETVTGLWFSGCILDLYYCLIQCFADLFLSNCLHP